MVTLSSAKLLIIVLVISQEEEIITTPMKAFQKMVLPWPIWPGLPALESIRNPPQTNKMAATGGIRPINTKSIIFLSNLKRSHFVHSAGLAEVPQGTMGHQEGAAKETSGKTSNSSTEKIINFRCFIA